jgi:4-diphosphocytidyl-2-C-methyl-D-erythritol kinase
MILFPNAKINLGLHIVGRRADGFHDLETVMIPVRGLCDALEVIPGSGEACEFSASGLPIDGPPEKNLCVRAWQSMRERYGVGGVRMHLHKHIPFGAGLGGGSADAAFALRAIGGMFGLGLTEDELETLAAALGSDTAFFVRNRPALAAGRGEVLTPVGIDLSGCYLVVVKPSFGVSTAEAYRHVTPATPEKPLEEIVSAPVADWRNGLKNDFEPSLFARYPELARIKARLYEAGAFYASLSGSGSALYGLFENAPETGRFADLPFVHLEKML